LACEDQALIGLALERDLEDAGFDIVGPFTSVAAALAWVETSTPDLAVLDYKLQDGSCTALVGVLRERGVPVVIHSGWQR
jgi:DNA-binding response OmpR family regulator